MAAQTNNDSEIELHLLIDAIYLKYHYDFRRYAPASLKRRITAALAPLGCEPAVLLVPPQLRQTRAGGRCVKPHCSQQLPVSPNFQVSARDDGGAAGRSGSGRRGGSSSTRPRHDR